MRRAIATVSLPLAILASCLDGCRFRRDQREEVRIPEITQAFRSKYRPDAALVDWKEIRSARAALIAALEGNRFDELDRILGGARRDFEANPAAEARLFWLFEAFGRTAPSWEAAFQAWEKARPGGPLALAAHAFHQAALGWEARGSAYAGKTSRDQFEAMAGHFRIAEAEALEALRLDPNLIAAYFPLIRMARGSSSPRLPEYVGRALAIDPVSYQIMFAYMISLEPRWGGSYAAMDRFAAAARIGADLNPELGILAGLSAWDRGRLLYDEERYDSARIEFRTALEAGPFFDAHVRLGETWSRLGRSDLALGEFDEAIAVRPLDAEARVEKALLLLRLGRSEEAEAAFREVAAMDPWDDEVRDYPSRAADIWVSRGYEAMGRKEYPQALADLDSALRMDSASSEAHYYRAHVRIRQGEAALAVAEADAAIRLDPRSFEACKLMDDFLARQGDWRRILAYWDAFLALQPRHAEALFERSGTHFHAGDLRQAEDDARASCALGWKDACDLMRARSIPR